MNMSTKDWCTNTPTYIKSIIGTNTRPAIRRANRTSMRIGTLPWSTDTRTTRTSIIGIHIEVEPAAGHAATAFGEPFDSLLDRFVGLWPSRDDASLKPVQRLGVVVENLVGDVRRDFAVVFEFPNGLDLGRIVRMAVV